MALFKRRKQETDVLPAEVREYYQSERRERAGVAWLLALGTLFLTFFIAAGLFFGGRWVYRTVFNNDKGTNQTASQNDGSLRVDEKGNVIGGNNNQPATTGTSSASTNTPSPTTPTKSGAANTPTTTPNTGDVTPAQLIDTGPGNDE